MNGRAIASPISRPKRSAFSTAFPASSPEILKEDHELVAADPGDEVGARRLRSQPVGDLAEEPVADVMALAVVEDLELVEIDEQQCAAMPAAARSPPAPRGARSISMARLGSLVSGSK